MNNSLIAAVFLEAGILYLVNSQNVYKTSKVLLDQTIEIVMNMRMRLAQHPLLKKLMSEKSRVKFANYMHENYGSLIGNFCFGMLLGLTGLVGYLTHLPLDIRHVAFSSANLGYSAVSGQFAYPFFLQCIAHSYLILLLKALNLRHHFQPQHWPFH